MKPKQKVIIGVVALGILGYYLWHKSQEKKETVIEGQYFSIEGKPPVKSSTKPKPKLMCVAMQPDGTLRQYSPSWGSNYPCWQGGILNPSLTR